MINLYNNKCVYYDSHIYEELGDGRLYRYTNILDSNTYEILDDNIICYPTWFDSSNTYTIHLGTTEYYFLNNCLSHFFNSKNIVDTCKYIIKTSGIKTYVIKKETGEFIGQNLPTANVQMLKRVIAQYNDKLLVFHNNTLYLYNNLDTNNLLTPTESSFSNRYNYFALDELEDEYYIYYARQYMYTSDSIFEIEQLRKDSQILTNETNKISIYLDNCYDMINPIIINNDKYYIMVFSISRIYCVLYNKETKEFSNFYEAYTGTEFDWTLYSNTNCVINNLLSNVEETEDGVYNFKLGFMRYTDTEKQVNNALTWKNYGAFNIQLNCNTKKITIEHLYSTRTERVYNYIRAVSMGVYLCVNKDTIDTYQYNNVTNNIDIIQSDTIPEGKIIEIGFTKTGNILLLTDLYDVYSTNTIVGEYVYCNFEKSNYIPINDFSTPVETYLEIYCVNLANDYLVRTYTIELIGELSFSDTETVKIKQITTKSNSKLQVPIYLTDRGTYRVNIK